MEKAQSNKSGREKKTTFEKKGTPRKANKKNKTKQKKDTPRTLNMQHIQESKQKVREKRRQHLEKAQSNKN